MSRLRRPWRDPPRVLGYAISLVLAVCAITSLVLTLQRKLDPSLGGPLAAVFSLLGVLAPQLEKLLKPVQAAVERRRVERATAQAQEEERKRELRRVTAFVGRVAEARPEVFGVSRSVVAERIAHETGAPAPYVPRRQDEQLRALLTNPAETFVLLVGPSKAGKSRTAYEVARSAVGEQRLVVPLQSQLHAGYFGHLFEDVLHSGDAGRPPYLLWLDDLDRCLLAGALDSQVLDAVRRHGVMVLGAMQQGLYNAWRHPTERERAAPLGADQVLRAASVVLLRSELASATERELASRHYGAVDWERQGLGPALISGPELLDKFQTGLQAGVRLVCAAVDWFRAGATRPITRDELAGIWRVYGRPASQPARSEEFDVALAWATDEIVEGSSLAILMRAGDDAETYIVHDYVLAYRSGQGEAGPHQGPIPIEAWSWIVEHLGPEEALQTLRAAAWAGNVEAANLAWQRARQSSNRMVVTEAAAHHAHVVNWQDGPEHAIPLYDEILDEVAGVDEPQMTRVVAEVLLGKGVAVWDLDGPEPAIEVFDDLIARHAAAGEPSVLIVVADAERNKARALRELGRPEAAVGVLDEALARLAGSTDPMLRNSVAHVFISKGVTLDQMGRFEDAIRVYDQLVEQGEGWAEPEVCVEIARAFFNRGAALAKLGRTREAMAAFEQADRRLETFHGPGTDELAADALLNRAAALSVLGDHAAAAEAYQLVVARFDQGDEAGLMRRVAEALHSRAMAILRAGDPMAAHAAFQQVIDRYGHEKAIRIQRIVAASMMGRAYSTPDHYSAMKYYQEIVDRYWSSSDPELQRTAQGAREDGGLRFRLLNEETM